MPKISRGVRVLPPKKDEPISKEFEKLQVDANEIEKWWNDSRWKHTKRTYKGMYRFTEKESFSVAFTCRV